MTDWFDGLIPCQCPAMSMTAVLFWKAFHKSSLWRVLEQGTEWHLLQARHKWPGPTLWRLCWNAHTLPDSYVSTYATHQTGVNNLFFLAGDAILRSKTSCDSSNQTSGMRHSSHIMFVQWMTALKGFCPTGDTSADVTVSCSLPTVYWLVRLRGLHSGCCAA